MKKIGIVILATNAYFVLGIRFIKKFHQYYKGSNQIKFYFFSDCDPHEYLPDDIIVHFEYDYHDDWVSAVHSKFKDIVGIGSTLIQDTDYTYFFDADTNINKDFTEEWFLGDLVGGEHFGNRTWLKNGAGFDRNPLSMAYVPVDTELPCTYYYGAFFGGRTNLVIDLCKTLISYQASDKLISYEPGVNDESFLNKYFHFNPPTYTVPCEKFEFIISDKGSIENTRNSRLDIRLLKSEILRAKNKKFDIIGGKVVLFD